MTKLTHFTEGGDARMVDISAKDDTERIATASARIRMDAATAEVIRNGSASKGDVLGVAQIAGIMAAKNTSQSIPMCHPLMLTSTGITFDIGHDYVDIEATVKTTGKTGVEMEALSAVSVTALTIYDMVKAIDRGMVIERIQLEHKDGGRSGVWDRQETPTINCDDGSCSIDISGSRPSIDLESLAGLGGRPGGIRTNHSEFGES